MGWLEWGEWESIEALYFCVALYIYSLNGYFMDDPTVPP
jgi:hypothetical protein